MESTKHTKNLNKLKWLFYTSLLMLLTVAMGACDEGKKKDAPSVFGTTTDDDSDYLQPITEDEKEKEQPIIEMADTLIELGDVKKGMDSERIAKFKFYNKGKAPLVIQKVEAYCACTKATFTEEPVAPGKHGWVEVTFDADLMVGRTFKKNLQVLSNAKNGPQLIKVSGTISY